MAIIKDKTRNKYYISYKWKTPSGEWVSAKIRNKDWIIEGNGKVGIRYMQSIERDEIEKDKAKKQMNWHEDETIKLEELVEQFYQVMLSQGIDKDTIYSYQLSIKNYLYPICPPTHTCEMAFTQRNIDLIRANLINKKLCSHTINIKLNTFRKLIAFAKKRKYLNRDTADDCIDLLDRVKERKKITDKSYNFFEKGEEDLRAFENSFKEVDSHWRVPVFTMFYGALRLGEWQALKVSDVNIKNCEIKVSKQLNASGQLKENTKNGNDRIVKLPSPFMKEIEDYIKERMLDKNDYLFQGQRGEYCSRTTFRRLIDKHLELAKIKHITIHGLRHSFATRMFDKGYDIKEVQEHLGHTSMNTTMQYYIHYTKRQKNIDDLM